MDKMPISIHGHVQIEDCWNEGYSKSTSAVDIRRQLPHLLTDSCLVRTTRKPSLLQALTALELMPLYNHTRHHCTSSGPSSASTVYSMSTAVMTGIGTLSMTASKIGGAAIGATTRGKISRRCMCVLDRMWPCTGDIPHSPLFGHIIEA